MKVFFALGELPQEMDIQLSGQQFEDDRYFEWSYPVLPKVGNLIDNNLIALIYPDMHEKSKFDHLIFVVSSLTWTAEDDGEIVPALVLNVEGLR